MELERVHRPGDFYRHFKGRLYQVIAIAIHSETKESMVVYQALYGGFYTFVRPYEMFVSEVDHDKYPEATQKYRFERIKRMDAEMLMKQQPAEDTVKEFEESEEIAYRPNDDVNQDLIAFLDAKSPEEKLEILYSIRDRIDDKLLNSIEISLDVIGNDGTIDDRIDYVKNHLQTRARYENNRLR